MPWIRCHYNLRSGPQNAPQLRMHFRPFLPHPIRFAGRETPPPQIALSIDGRFAALVELSQVILVHAIGWIIIVGWEGFEQPVTGSKCPTVLFFSMNRSRGTSALFSIALVSQSRSISVLVLTSYFQQRHASCTGLATLDLAQERQPQSQKSSIMLGTCRSAVR